MVTRGGDPSEVEISVVGKHLLVTPAGGVKFLGQRYHSCVLLVGAGFGMLMGVWLHDRLLDAKWVWSIGLLVFFSGWIWWMVLWRRSLKNRPA